jgi:hypothetical protein
LESFAFLTKKTDMRRTNAAMSVIYRDGQVWAVSPSAVLEELALFSPRLHCLSLVSNASMWTTCEIYADLLD